MEFTVVQITFLAYASMFAGAALMYGWLSVPRSDEEKRKVALQLIIGALVALLGFVAIPFVPESILKSKMVRRLPYVAFWGAMVFGLIRSFVERKRERTAADYASGYRVMLLLLIGFVLLMAACWCMVKFS